MANVIYTPLFSLLAVLTILRIIRFQNFSHSGGRVAVSCDFNLLFLISDELEHLFLGLNHRIPLL